MIQLTPSILFSLGFPFLLLGIPFQYHFWNSSHPLEMIKPSKPSFSYYFNNAVLNIRNLLVCHSQIYNLLVSLFPRCRRQMPTMHLFHVCLLYLLVSQAMTWHCVPMTSISRWTLSCGPRVYNFPQVIKYMPLNTMSWSVFAFLYYFSSFIDGFEVIDSHSATCIKNVTDFD